MRSTTRNIRWQWLILAVSAVLPAHVHLFNVLDVIRVEGDNKRARLPVSVAASFTGFSVVSIVSDNSSSPRQCGNLALAYL